MTRKLYCVAAVLLGLVGGLLVAELLARSEGSYRRHLTALDNLLEWKAAREGVSALPRIGDESRDIIVIGDSFSVGYLLSREEAWPARLERRLQAPEYALEETVGNFARSGTNLGHHLRTLERVLSRATPKLVLLQLFVNDFTIVRYGDLSGIAERPPPPRFAWLGLWFQRHLTQSHVGWYLRRATLRYPTEQEGWLGWMQRFGPAELPHWREVRRDYHAIADLAAAASVPIVTFMMPAQIWDGREYPFTELHESARASIEPVAEHYYDLLSFLQEQAERGRDHWVSTDLPDAHPDAQTHKWYSIAVLRYLEESGLVARLQPL